MRELLSAQDFRFGLEHEFAVLDSLGRFCDFNNTTFEELQRVVDELPVFETDYPGLRVGDLGIKRKRWYIEGFERFSDEGLYLRTDPKGFEIRTPICDSLDEAIAVLETDIARWSSVAERFGYRAARVALNPLAAEYVPAPELNAYEIAQRRSPEELTAHIHMLTYGPDISFSHSGLSAESTVDIARKLTFYSPFIVPFSFASPFYRGQPWGGYSRRTYYRTGARPSVLVFVDDPGRFTPSVPTLTDRARVPAEAGRIEFKAFDCISEPALYRALGTLLVGLALDRSLPGRAQVPDAALHRVAAEGAFDDPSIFAGARDTLDAACRALPAELQSRLDPLGAMLEARRTPAHAMLDIYRETGDLLAAIL